MHSEQAAHRWNDGEITKAPTYDAEGVTTYTCIDCGYKRTESINKLEGDEVGISVTRMGGGSVYASAAKGVYGDKINISADAAEGYRFSGWKLTGAKAKLDDSSSPDTVLTIKATSDQHGTPVKVTAIFDIDISKEGAELSETEFTYNGSTQRPEVKYVGEGNNKKPFDEDLYTLEWSDEDSKDSGNYYVVIRGRGNGKNGYPVGETRASYSIKRVSVDIPQGKTLTYNGKSQTGVKGNEFYKVTGGAKTNAGSYEASVSLADKKNCIWADGTTDDKSVSFSISKAANPLSVKGRTAAVKYSKLAKKSQLLKRSKVVSITKKGRGTMSYTLSSAKKGSQSYKKYFKIAKSTGKLTVKKGLKKGTYKVTVKVKAAGTGNYKPSALKTVTVTVKVK